MILKRVRLQNFRCVKDSGTFKIDENVTCLVGKNESGKTALLQALNKLNPVIAEEKDFQDLDYPAMEWTEYKTRKDTDPAPALTTFWLLETADVELLSPVFGDSIDYASEICVAKGFSNVRTSLLEVDEEKLVQHLITRHGLLEDEKECLKSTSRLADLLAVLTGVKDPSSRQKELLEYLKTEFATANASEKARSVLTPRLPHFVYFSDFLRLPGRVSITDLKSRVAKSDPKKPLRGTDRAYLAYLSLIGATADDLERANEFERLTRELESASNHLTAQMKKYWSQNRYLRVDCRFDAALSGDPEPFNTGFVARTRIENTRHGVTTSFDERSAGFVWFFSFLVWFSQVKKEYGENVVILLDEPGLSLHAKAQHDLLRYIEQELAPRYQIIYTTHSPFMVDPENLLRARTVEDVFIPAAANDHLQEDQDLGTKVGDDVLSTDRDTVFPLQGCLGYEITQTLFVGKHTLLVEGPSDLLYLSWFRRRLTAASRTSLDRRWTITPCGGLDKVASFVALFGGNKIHAAVLTDFALGDKSKMERLRRSRLLSSDHIFTADTYADKPEADVEDIIGNGAYVDLVNRALGLTGDKCIKEPIEAGRVVKWVEDQTRTLPPEVHEFDHYMPAEFLMSMAPTEGLAEEEATLARFEKLFADLNAILPK